jgi:hypothetical protein
MHGHAHHPLPAWASPRHILEAYLGTPGSVVLLLRKVVFGAFHMHGVVLAGAQCVRTTTCRVCVGDVRLGPGNGCLSGGLTAGFRFCCLRGMSQEGHFCVCI